jgi:ribosomal protein S18 acetylase RimI-like enzyme
MISIDLQVRPAESADEQQIANLIFFEAQVHRHLDWRTPLEWLGSAHYWVLEDQGRITAALACPQESPGVSWIRLFAYNPRLSGPDIWSPLWTAARSGMARTGGAYAAAIAIKPWFQDVLSSHGFEIFQRIVLLEWTSHPMAPHPILRGINLRPMLAADLPAVAEVDASAFEPLWRNSCKSLKKAYTQAVCATVAETSDGIVGYQISTGNPAGAHLARLAVRLEAQDRGVGSALVHDLIARLRTHRVLRLSVNTQADNTTSLALYQRFGFARTGEQYPVYVYRVENES